MGAYTLPALGSVAGPVWVWSRARFTHGQIRGCTQDREATQRNLGEETRAWWERESRGKKHTDTGNRSTYPLLS